MNMGMYMLLSILYKSPDTSTNDSNVCWFPGLFNVPFTVLDIRMVLSLVILKINCCLLLCPFLNIQVHGSEEYNFSLTLTCPMSKKHFVLDDTEIDLS